MRTPCCTRSSTRRGRSRGGDDPDGTWMGLHARSGRADWDAVRPLRGGEIIDLGTFTLNDASKPRS